MNSPATLHSGMPVLFSGAPVEKARAAMILLHGRGATAEDIMGVSAELDLPGTVFLAPQAADFTWYPQRFIAPLEQNEPWLSSALQVIERLFQQLTVQGIPAERISLLGFSQGACLALEYVARNPRRYGGVFGLSGALIGPPGMFRTSSGDLHQTYIFMGCSNIDPHIPIERVNFTAGFLKQLRANVDVRIYPGMGHSINADELHAIHRAAIALET